jgi:hypothetical protein
MNRAGQRASRYGSPPIIIPSSRVPGRDPALGSCPEAEHARGSTTRWRGFGASSPARSRRGRTASTGTCDLRQRRVRGRSAPGTGRSDARPCWRRRTPVRDMSRAITMNQGASGSRRTGVPRRARVDREAAAEADLSTACRSGSRTSRREAEEVDGDPHRACRHDLFAALGCSRPSSAAMRQPAATDLHPARSGGRRGASASRALHPGRPSGAISHRGSRRDDGGGRAPSRGPQSLEHPRPTSRRGAEKRTRDSSSNGSGEAVT